MTDFNDIGKDWPKIFPRKEGAKLIGNGISPRTLANLDSLGLGPTGRFKIGRVVYYRKENFLDWLKSRTIQE